MKHIGKVMRMIVATTLAIAICLAGTPQTAKAAEIIGWTEWYPEAQSRYEGPSSPSGYREEKIETKYQYSRFLWYGPSSTNSTVTYRAASFRLVPSGWTLNKEVTTDSYSGANNGKYNVRRSALLDAPVPMSSSGGWTINGVTYWQEDKIQKRYFRYAIFSDTQYVANSGDGLWTDWTTASIAKYAGYPSETKTETRYQYSRFLWYGPSSTNSTVTYRAASFRLVPSGWTLNKEVTADSYSGANNGKYNVRRSALLDAPVSMSSSGGWIINGVTYWQEDKVQTTYYRYLLPYQEYLKNMGL